MCFVSVSVSEYKIKNKTSIQHSTTDTKKKYIKANMVVSGRGI